MTSSVSARHSLFFFFLFFCTLVISALVSWPRCPKSGVVMVTPREKVVLLVSVVTRRGEDAVSRRVHLLQMCAGFGFHY